MRNCGNCDFSSYGLDCNTGIETLYCTETGYDFEVDSKYVCESHQFVDGMENEKNFILYDDNILGEGFFIVHTEDGKITKFFKIYIMNNNCFPNYGLRAFSVDGKDNPDPDFNNIEFVFRSREDFDNGLYDAFLEFAKNADKTIYTIDESQQGKNNISTTIKGEIVKIIISKDAYRGKQHPSDFIDINLGDNYSSQNYEAINSLYNALAKNCLQIAKKEVIKRLLMLKIK